MLYEVITIAATQMEDGGAWHQYQPLTKRGNADIGGNFNDDPLWLIHGVTTYIKETGDFAILDEEVPFNNDETVITSYSIHYTKLYEVATSNLFVCFSRMRYIRNEMSM